MLISMLNSSCCWTGVIHQCLCCDWQEVIQRHPLHTISQLIHYMDGFGKPNIALKTGQVGKALFHCYIFQCHTEVSVCCWLHLMQFPVWACTLTKVTLLIITNDSCWFPCWVPTPRHQNMWLCVHHNSVSLSDILVILQIVLPELNLDRQQHSFTIPVWKV